MMSLQAVGSYLNLNEKVTVPHSLAGPAAPTSLFRSPSPAESSLLVRSARALRLDGISTVTRNLNFVARLDLPNLNSELKARASVTRILRLLRPLAGRSPGCSGLGLGWILRKAGIRTESISPACPPAAPFACRLAPHTRIRPKIVFWSLFQVDLCRQSASREAAKSRRIFQ